MNPLITIITPIYNAENYIKYTIDSIINQEFQDFELILLNDGSTDNSSKICIDYARKDSRIKFIDKKNEGVSTTRNIGLKIAQGKYIMFVDSDDIIFPDSLNTIKTILLDIDPDLLRYNFTTINKNGEHLYPNYLSKKRAQYANKELSSDTFIKKIIANEYFLCLNIFKKSILKKHSIYFKDGCTYNEDTLFILQYLQYSQTHIYTPHVIYGYRKHDGAVTAKFTIKNYEDLLEVFHDLINLANAADPKMKRSMQSTIQNIGWYIYCQAPNFNDKKNKNEIRKICSIQPIIIEWTLVTYLGEIITSLIYPLIKIIKRIYRKITYIA